MIGRNRLRRLGRRAVSRYVQNPVGLARLLRIHPDVRDELLWEAAQRLDAGAIDDARMLYTVVLQLWLDSSTDACLGLGACLESDGDLDSAIEIYGSILVADPDHLLARANRADCRLRVGQIDAARDDLQAAETTLTHAKRPPAQVAPRLAQIRARLDALPSEPTP